MSRHVKDLKGWLSGWVTSGGVYPVPDLALVTLSKASSNGEKVSITVSDGSQEYVSVLLASSPAEAEEAVRVLGSHFDSKLDVVGDLEIGS